MADMANLISYVRRLRGRREAFRRMFLGPNGLPNADGSIVLWELRKFCYGDRATLKLGKDGAVDPYASIAAAARQEVYMRIIKLMYLSEKDLIAMEKHAQENPDG